MRTITFDCHRGENVDLRAMNVEERLAYRDSWGIGSHPYKWCQEAIEFLEKEEIKMVMENENASIRENEK